MRCALSFDENKPLYEQEIAAWGEMQSLKDEPAYKESDIKDEQEKALFRGSKIMAEEVATTIEGMQEDGDISEEAVEHIEACIQGELAMMLFSILDNQEED